MKNNICFITGTNNIIDIVNGSQLSKCSKVSGKNGIFDYFYRIKVILKFIFRIKIDNAICVFKFFKK
ncbi:hypothetical protein [Candidatus Endomicrobiellum cubanum]|uniref:hypothetical protein n=1 Tax=Candidatus Endomicrobiellum cubanum TaxID=3242325 RepID=UPI003593B6E0